jgi:hypothetical protein
MLLSLPLMDLQPDILFVPLLLLWLRLRMGLVGIQLLVFLIWINVTP